MATSSNLFQSAQAMISANKKCVNCWHNREGHCSMYSCSCATAVFNRASNPLWWTSYEDGEEQERRASGK